MTGSNETGLTPRPMVAAKPGWRATLSAVALATLVSVAGPAQALGLGRMSVQSSLGEALRAEIDVTSMSTDEASSLAVRIASPETFRASGVDYAAVLSGTRATLARRADGRPVIRLSSDRPVNEPFVDVILELNWSSGRMTREYTLLVDPPRTAGSAAAVAAPATVTTTARPTRPAAPPPAPAVAAAPAPAPAVAAAPAPAVTTTSRPAPAPAVRAPAPAPRPAARTARAPAAAPAARRAVPDEVTVRRGDSLSAIAARVSRPGVSLDQMLVALYRSNQQAFIGENMNLLRAGDTLKVPSAAEAGAVEAGAARELIHAHAVDFDAYRRRLASGVRDAGIASSRRASGQVQSAVEDKRQAEQAAADRLRLSQGRAAASTAEASISRDTQAKAEAARVAELDRNMRELRSLQGGASAPAGTAVTAPAAAASAPTRPGVTVPIAAPTLPAAASAPAAVTARAASAAQTAASSAAAAAAATRAAASAAPALVAQAASAAASSASSVAAAGVAHAASATASAANLAAAAASAAASSADHAARAAVNAASAASAAVAVASAYAPASAPAPVAAAKPPAAPLPHPSAEPGFFETLMENPYLVPIGSVLGLGLAGALGWRLLRRNREQIAETNFAESKVDQDSFFGVSGGQHVDTHDGAATQSAGAASSLNNYSLSQLDANGDVDPVAEADVYLAYGRDLQAEEILKEAMRANPERLAIRAKLLEVYAKRRDNKGFELLAAQMYALTGGSGEDWDKAQELGRSIDPANPLYAAGGAPGMDAVADRSVSVLPREPAAEHVPTVSVAPPEMAEEVLDLDLNEPVPTPARETGYGEDSLLEASSMPGTLFPAEPKPVSASANQRSEDASPSQFDPFASLSSRASSSDGAPSSSNDAGLDFTLDEASAGRASTFGVPAFGTAAPGGDASRFMVDPTPSTQATRTLTTEEMARQPDAPESSSPAPLDFDLSSISLDLDAPAPAPASASVATSAPRSQDDAGPDSLGAMPDLDLSVPGELAPAAQPSKASRTEALASASVLPDISFDLPETSEDSGSGDPLERKIELAEEFRQIGDFEGARDLLQEVIAQGDAPAQSRARALLAKLD